MPAPCVRGAGQEWEASVGAVLRDHARTLPLSPRQQRIAWRLAQCRTGGLGSRFYVCDECGADHVGYHSCRDRHCPRCGSVDQGLWAEQQASRVLHTHYFHAVFTVPPALHDFFRAAPAVAYAVLFEAVSLSLLEVAHGHLGAVLGITAVLHTWSQRLTFHPHVHCLVTGGGLSLDGLTWIATRSNYLLPLGKLQRVFKGKLLHALEDAVNDGRIPFNRTLARHLRLEAARKDWDIFLKPPLAGPEQVLTYFSRYARKVAISNSRVRSYDGETVEVYWRDRADGNRRKLRRLSGAKFTRLFLQHVLPRRFVRIRHYGLLANRSAGSFARSRDLLARGKTEAPAPSLPPAGETRAEATLRLFGKNPLLCPACRRGRLVALAVASACGKVRWLGTPFPTPKPIAVISAPARAPT